MMPRPAPECGAGPGQVALKVNLFGRRRRQVMECAGGTAAGHSKLDILL